MTENIEAIKNKVTQTANRWALRLTLAGGLASVGALVATESAFADPLPQNFGNCSLTGDAVTIYLANSGLVGPCTENEQFTDSTGLNSFQHTAGGEFFKTNGRKAFTNGGITLEVNPCNGTVVSRVNTALFDFEQNPNLCSNPNVITQPIVVTTQPANTVPVNVVTNPGFPCAMQQQQGRGGQQQQMGCGGFGMQQQQQNGRH